MVDRQEGHVRVSLLRRSLAAKIIVSLAVLLVLITAVHTALETQYERRELVESKIRGAIREADLVKRSISSAMLKGRLDEVRTIVESIGEQEGTLGVRIFDSTGKVKVSADSTQVGVQLDRTDSVCVGCHGATETKRALASGDQARLLRLDDGRQAVRVIHPIYNTEPCFSCHDQSIRVLGVLDVVLSLDDVEEVISRSAARNVGYSASTVLVMCLAGAGLIMILVRNPVKELVTVMRRAESGDLKARVRVTTSDELGKLGETFNSMADALQQATTKLEQQVTQADKLASLGELMAGIAHEVKNPLAGIAAATQVLSDEFEEGDSGKGVSREILSQVDRLDRIVKDFLRFARPSLPRFSWNDLNEILERTTFFVRKQVEDKQAFLSKKYASDLPVVYVDPDKMQQAMLGLLINAVQAVGAGGRIEIRTRFKPHGSRNGGIALVEVQDNGVGISEDNLAKIFDPFFTTKHQGTGLGLSIVREIARQHGGSLLVVSTKGKGTTFTLRVPAAEASERLAGAAAV